MTFEHRERQWWVDEIAKINQRLNDDSTQKVDNPWH